MRSSVGARTRIRGNTTNDTSDSKGVSPAAVQVIPVTGTMPMSAGACARIPAISRARGESAASATRFELSERRRIDLLEERRERAVEHGAH